MVAGSWWLGRPVGAVGTGTGIGIGIGTGAFRYSRRGLRLRRRGRMASIGPPALGAKGCVR